jgi:hypothetical protein
MFLISTNPVVAGGGSSVVVCGGGGVVGEGDPNACAFPPIIIISKIADMVPKSKSLFFFMSTPFLIVKKIIVYTIYITLLSSPNQVLIDYK